eukprot:gene15952-17557_t
MSRLSHFFTHKHTTHDVIWMVQDSNTDTLCFACLMEVIGDQNELNFKKRKITSIVLDILLSNKFIGNLLASNSAIFIHTGDILLRHLLTKDSNFQFLLIETLSVLIKKSTVENTKELLNLLLCIVKENQRENYEVLPAFVTILGKILRNSNQAVEIIIGEHFWLMEKVANYIMSSDNETEIASYWYVFCQIYQKAGATRVDIRISNIVIKCISATITKSSHKNVLLNTLGVLTYLLKNASLKQLMYDHENEKMDCNAVCFTEGLKKLLLFTCTNVQLAAIHCIVELITDVSNEPRNQSTICLVDRFIDKGVCELLFELLDSSDCYVLESVLLCLLRFTRFQKFFSTGHVIFGLQPVISALTRIVELKNEKLLQDVLVLVLVILQKADAGIFSRENHLNDVVKVLADVNEKQQARTIIFSILCAKEIFMRLIDPNENSLCKILEKTGSSLLKEAQNGNKNNSGNLTEVKENLDLLSAYIEVIHCIVKSIDRFQNGNDGFPEMPENASRKVDILINSVYFLVDNFCIPVTLLWLQSIKDNTTFARFIKENDANTLASSANNFIISLTCTLEDSNDAIAIRSMLTKALPALATSPCDWHLYFTGKLSTSDDADSDVVHCCRSASLAILYASARFGDAIWRAEAILKALSIFLSCESNFTDLADISKRHFLYLWSTGQQSEPLKSTQHKSYFSEVVLFRYLDDPNAFESCYFHEKDFIRWLLTSAVNYPCKQLCLARMFSYDQQGLSHKERINCAFEALMPLVDNERLQIYIMLCDMLSDTDENMCSIVLHVTTSLLRSSAFNGQLLNPAKEFMHKTILSRTKELRHWNICALYEVFKSINLSRDPQLTEVDLKFVFRACHVFLEYPYLDVRISILNCIIQMLGLMRSSLNCHAQISVLCNADFLKEARSLIPCKLEFIDVQAERLCAAALVFISELSAMLTAVNDLPSMNLNKDALITGLAYSESKLIQLACLKFWRNFILTTDRQPNCSKMLFGFVAMEMDEAKAIVISLQNLLINQERILREAALQCFAALLNAMISHDNMYQNPWNSVLLEQASLDIADADNMQHNLKLLHLLLHVNTPMPDDFVNRISSAIKQYTGASNQNQVLDNLFLAIVYYVIDHDEVCEDVKDELNCFLHKIEDETNEVGSVNKATQGDQIDKSVIEASGVIFLWDDHFLPITRDYTKDVQSYRDKLMRTSV